MDRNRRRKFGQNFLNNQGIIDAIAGDLPIKPGDTVLEVGPGHGALTKSLLARGAHVTSVEIDIECIKFLKFKIEEEHFKLIHANFMDFDLEPWLVANPNAWIVGNLPYNMATPILMKILPLAHLCKGTMAMVQYEPGKRLCAQPGTRNFGHLTVMLQSYATCNLLRKVEPLNFTPIPRVMSATIMIEALAVDQRREVKPGFFTFLAQCFAQKRKKMYNSLETIYPKALVKKALAELEIEEGIRAEHVHTAQFFDLFDKLGLPEVPESLKVK
tara:strand:- start:1150 stop:1965 length:816 start_codon:yes stop_codon:yes gene_type:complete